MKKLKRSLPQDALRDWQALCTSIRNLNKLLVLLDYDGTLAPIAPTPEQAHMPAATRLVLRRLSRLQWVTVGIVSGRSLQTVKQLVRVPGLVYVGNHGCEVQGRGLSFEHPKVKRSRGNLKLIARELREALADIRGSLVEFKGLSLSVHWRRVHPRKRARFEQVTSSVLRPWKDKRKIRVTYGKCVVEVRAPVIWHKGTSVEWLVRRLSPRPTGVWYLGDDRTDEDAFRAVNRLRGVSIFVGRRRLQTAARWQLASPAEVRSLLVRVCSAHRLTAVRTAKSESLARAED